MNNKNRDSIDFGTMSIPRLFVKLFVPTLLGLIFSALLNIVDGVVVGHGVGSDALAAVNIAAPIFLLSSSVSLMFATGVSIVASVHLSHGNSKAANINVTQALTVPLIPLALLSVAMLFGARQLGFIFGGSEALSPYVEDYLHWLTLFPLLQLVMVTGSFVMRLDGSPKLAMCVNMVPAVLNSALDVIFVFPLHWGIMGAAFATSISAGVGAAMVAAYLLFFSKNIHLYRPKFTRTSLYLTMRNIGYMAKLGFPTFVGEGAISCMMIAGNYMFMAMLHEDGVAAFSVCCYTFPLVFMFGNAIAQSQLPIVSYNYGLGDTGRIRTAFHFAVRLTAVLGTAMVLFGVFCCRPLITLFLDPATNAFRIAVEGFPLFSLSFVFFSLNVVLIGFWQSVERAKEAVTFMLLRGVVFLLPAFLLLPRAIGVSGLWLAVPLSEAVTFVVIAAITFKRLNLITRPRAKATTTNPQTPAHDE